MSKRSARVSFLTNEQPKIWFNPRVTPNVVIYAKGSVFVGDVPCERLREVAELFHTGASPQQIFGDSMREVAFVSVTHAEVDKRHNSFSFWHTAGLGTARTSFRMADAFEADALLTILRGQVGNTLAIEPMGLNLPRVLGLPLAALLIQLTIMIMLWTLTRARGGLLDRTTLVGRVMQNFGEDNLLKVAAGIAAVIGIWVIVRFVCRPGGLVLQQHRP